MSRRTRIAGFFMLALSVLAAAPVAFAGTIQIGVYSQNERSDHASAGASISDVSHRTGTPSHRGARGEHATESAATATSSAAGANVGGAAPTPVYPTLPNDAPLLRNSHPFGGETLWYSDGSGHACVSPPPPPPFSPLRPPPAVPARPATDPATIAAALAARVDLSLGEIRSSPNRVGLTGADSWFWLDPAPAARSLSITLAGESVTVSATPSIVWRFGDGASLDGGPGRPYAPGSHPPPADAIRHSYQTRCLPGDQGRNPYVLASCAADGYRVEASISWQLSYQASGPIARTGVLPTRTTTTVVAYPVSEVRGFLVAGASP